MLRKLLLFSLLLVPLVLGWPSGSGQAPSAASQERVAVPPAANPLPVSVRTIIENGTVFPDPFNDWINLAAGDVTQDGNLDLVITKSYAARAAVFQTLNGEWDAGTLLAGPSISVASRPIVAPIRNDGQNWLVYSEHSSGNTGEWLRGHRYLGTALVENQDIASRFGWPGWFSPSVGDLDGDGTLEIWLTSQHDVFPNQRLHLRRHVWDRNSQSYPGVEIKAGEVNSYFYLWNQRPLTGDFVGDSTESLIWVPQRTEVELVTYTPGSGTYDHTSRLIHTTADELVSLDAGEVDMAPGTDLVFATWDGTSSSVFVLSGGVLQATEIASGVAEYLRTIRVGDLDGDGLAEVYGAGDDGGIYGYDAASGWRQLASHLGIKWWDGATGPQADAPGEEVFFTGIVGGRTFRVVSLRVEDLSFSISGRIQDPQGAAVEGMLVYDDGGALARTNSAGEYAITGLLTGTHALTPAGAVWTFEPLSRTVNLPPNAEGQDFTATGGASLPFADDFSGLQAWINDTSGHFHQDTANHWLAWQVHQATSEKYYLPIERHSGDFRLEARVKAIDWNGGGSFFFGLADDLSGSFSQPREPTGLFVEVNSYGGVPEPRRIHAYGTFSEHPRFISDESITYAMHAWYRIVFTVRGDDWSIAVYDEMEILVDEISGAFPASHSGFDYILLWSPDANEGPTGDGLFDELVAEGFAPAGGRVLLADGFDRPPLNADLWYFTTGGNGSYTVSGGFLHVHSGTIRGAGGNIRSYQQFEPTSSTLTYEVRAKVSAADGGHILLMGDGFEGTVGFGISADGVLQAIVRRDSAHQVVWIDVPGIDTTLWHTYRVELTDSFARYYVDDQAVALQTEHIPHDKSMRVLLSRASRGVNETLSVDWVRVSTSAHLFYLPLILEID